MSQPKVAVRVAVALTPSPTAPRSSARSRPSSEAWPRGCSARLSSPSYGQVPPGRRGPRQGAASVRRADAYGTLWPTTGDGSPAHSCSAGSPVVAVLVSARIALIADSRSRPQRNELGDGNVVDVHTAGLSSFQYPSEMTSRPPSVTLMAV
jgi:hypothetical protein